jgi:hypothetical protein
MTSVNVVVASFLCQHSWYNVSAEVMHPETVTEDGVTATNQNSDFLFSHNV